MTSSATGAGADRGAAWGDVDGNIVSLEAALERALEATRTDFMLWDLDGEGEDRWGDEYSVSPDDVAQMDMRWRLAYVARLVRSVALCYGVSPGEFSDSPPLLEAEGSTPAGIVRGLNDLVHLH